MGLAATSSAIERRQGERAVKASLNARESGVGVSGRNEDSNKEARRQVDREERRQGARSYYYTV